MSHSIQINENTNYRNEKKETNRTCLFGIDYRLCICWGVCILLFGSIIIFPQEFKNLIKDIELLLDSNHNNENNNKKIKNEIDINNINNQSQIIINPEIPCIWSNWSEWSECFPCGYSIQTRTRTNINQSFCIDEYTQSQVCYKSCPPCEITPWSDWFECQYYNNICGNGTQIRNRTILFNDFCNHTINTILQENKLCFSNCSETQLLNINNGVSSNVESKNLPKDSNFINEMLWLLLSMGGLFLLCMYYIIKSCRDKLKNNNEKQNKNVKNNTSLTNMISNPLYDPMFDLKKLKKNILKATEYDKKKKYKEAYKIYVESSTELLSMRDKETSQKKIKYYENHAKLYIERAEAIAEKFPKQIASIKKQFNTKNMKQKINKQNTFRLSSTNTTDKKNITSPLKRRFTGSSAFFNFNTKKNNEEYNTNKVNHPPAIKKEKEKEKEISKKNIENKEISVKITRKRPPLLSESIKDDDDMIIPKQNKTKNNQNVNVSDIIYNTNKEQNNVNHQNYNSNYNSESSASSSDGDGDCHEVQNEENIIEGEGESEQIDIFIPKDQALNSPVRRNISFHNKKPDSMLNREKIRHEFKIKPKSLYENNNKK